ncbi:hypothetical protein XENORESO_014062 [Xenotaenia resolanae]|uniref:Uncharacterized protein n=1 Tax=Xenotaenia resolanae TaxID=208358 RepID=A0ABV0WB22_9TELE
MSCWKTNPQSWGTSSQQKEAGFFQYNLQDSLIHVSFAMMDLPDSSPAKAPPYHHISSCSSYFGIHIAVLDLHPVKVCVLYRAASYLCTCSNSEVTQMFF